jgi:serine/threonine protein kinase
MLESQVQDRQRRHARDRVDVVPGALGGGRYRLGSLIGRGASSEVFRGRDMLLGRAVAIKLFPAGSAESEDQRRWREIRTLAGLNHPRLVSVYDVGAHLGRMYFVLQLVEGTNLSVRLTLGPLTLSRTLRLGSGVAAGLGHVHRHGVVHRDLKPANILLDRDDRPFLTDFGSATWLGAGAPPRTGVSGQPIEPATDVYALGLILLECLSGRREYPGDPASAAAARLDRPPDIPSELPEPVATTLRAMTHPEAARRPDAAHLARHFAALRDSATDDDPPPASASRP